MSNNKEIIEAAQRVFEKLSKMDSEEFKKLLEEHTKGDDYEEYCIPEEIFDYIVDGYSKMRRYINGLPNCPVCHGAAEWEDDEFGIMIRCSECGINTGGTLGEVDIFIDDSDLKKNHLKIWRGK